MDQGYRNYPNHAPGYGPGPVQQGGPPMQQPNGQTYHSQHPPPQQGYNQPPSPPPPHMGYQMRRETSERQVGGYRNQLPPGSPPPAMRQRGGSFRNQLPNGPPPLNGPSPGSMRGTGSSRGPPLRRNPSQPSVGMNRMPSQPNMGLRRAPSQPSMPPPGAGNMHRHPSHHNMPLGPPEGVRPRQGSFAPHLPPGPPPGPGVHLPPNGPRLTRNSSAGRLPPGPPPDMPFNSSRLVRNTSDRRLPVGPPPDQGYGRKPSFDQLHFNSARRMRKGSNLVSSRSMGSSRGRPGRSMSTASDSRSSKRKKDKKKDKKKSKGKNKKNNGGIMSTLRRKKKGKNQSAKNISKRQRVRGGSFNEIDPDTIEEYTRTRRRSEEDLSNTKEAWSVQWSDQHGKPYYFNKYTGASLWEPPAVMLA